MSATRETVGVAPQVNIRALRVTDILLANELRRLARWNQTEADWKGYLEYEPAGCFMAEVDGTPAGTATTIRYEDRVGWIGMVLVHPEWRGRGVGTRLLHHAITYLKSRAITCVKLDATPMGRKIYVPLGFRDEYGVTRYEGVAPAEAAASAFTSAQPFGAAALEDIAKFDSAAFGADRSPVLAELSQRKPDYCFVIGGGRQPEGYLIAREGNEAVQIGPWVARDLETARGLLGALFQRLPGRRIYLDVPQPNAVGATLVESYGFTVQRSFMRMYLGAENLRPGMPDRIFGTGGAEKG